MHHQAVFTSEESAKIRGTELKQGAKALVFKTEDKYVMAVISADRKVDLKKLKTIIGCKKMALAPAEDIKEETGLEKGAIPPFGSLFKMQVYLDKSLAENEIIAFNAGSHTDSVKMSYEDYVKVEKPIICDMAE